MPKFCLACLQIAKADLQKIADSINQAQSVYKQLKARREELSKAVEALKLMSDWQARLQIFVLLTWTLPSLTACHD